MGAMPYLIDGHNLIPKLGLRLDSPDDELQLVRVLQEFCRLERRTAEVYFDGAPPGQARVQRLGAVTAHFVRQGTTADAAIRLRLEQLGRAARNWIVVSSDHAVQASARGLHAASVRSEEFAALLRQAARRPAASGAQGRLSAEEVEEWMRTFSQKK